MIKRIFTFWEPKENLSGYIHLCMKTWSKFLPDYEIVVCDYKNLKDYLPKKVISQVVCKKMTLAMQSDAIRCALLKYNEGIWIDADTIITDSAIFENMKKSDCTMIGRKNDGVIYGAFIYTTKANTDFMAQWFKELVLHVRQFRWATFWNRLGYCKELWVKTHNWDWCVNYIIDPLAKKMSPEQFLYFDKDELYALPEYDSDLAKTETDKSRVYQNFYFKPGDATSILQKNKGIILLHNSWTPDEYKKMSEEEFLKQDILLADLLRKVLK